MNPMSPFRHGMLAMAVAAIVAFSAVPAFAAVVYRVDAASTASPPDGATWATAYPTLQAAMDAAATAGGGELWVKKGTYTALTDPVMTMQSGVDVYGGFAGTETDRDQRDWNLNPTTIDGENARRCVIASSNVLDGLVIARGSAARGGGMYGSNVSPRVANCVFDSNNATAQGGGVYGVSGTSLFQACSFKGNKAPRGGGIYYFMLNATLLNCVLQGNAASEIGGAFFTEGASCIIAMTNCTLVGNKADVLGGAAFTDQSRLTFLNSIVYANEAPSDPGIAIGLGFLSVSYSCIQGGWTGTGTNNIDADPLFVSAPDNLRLQATSPCVNMGSAIGAPATDFQGVARPQGASYDMGAYEYGVIAVPNLVNVTEAAATTALAAAHLTLGTVTRQYSRTVAAGSVIASTPATGSNTPFGTAVALTVSSGPPLPCRVDAASTAASPDGATWATAYPTLQAATDAAAANGGGELWVKKGTYTALTDPVMTMQSGVDVYGGFAGTETDRDQRDWNLNQTTIDGENARCCVFGADRVVLSGFVITRGNGISGGGGMYTMSDASTVDNCAFDSNATSDNGGGVLVGGIDQVFVGCSFTGNKASQGGGGMAIHLGNATLVNCAFHGNEASSGGGFYANGLNGKTTMTNCTFAGNRATANGGGIRFNAHDELLVLVNSIVYANEAPSDPSVSGEATTMNISHSCIQGGWTGTGNIAADPLFASAPDNLRLQATSPCIDTGTATGAPATDLQGLARPQGAGYDMGAYEYGEVPVPSVVDLTEAAATTALAAAHLTLGAVTQQCSNTVAVGSVISQVPAAGTEAPFHSAVALIVSTGVCNVTVPNVVNQTQANAGTALTGADLTLGAVTQQCSNTVAAGSVISQTPAAGTEAPFHSAVALVVSTGVCNVTVPNVVNQTQADAGTALTGAGLAVGTLTQQCSNTIAAGSVISQTPAAGVDAPFGSAVALAISTGVCNVTVPNVVNQTQADAGTALTSAGLTLGTVTQECSNTIAAGSVIRQTPAAGVDAPFGSAVVLAISTGVCNVTVPNVVNQTQADAGTALTSAGLTLGTVTQQCSNTVAAGSVISQIPAAGEEAPFGSAVALAISTGLCNVTVPNVVNQTQAAAEGALTGAGLAVGTVAQHYSNTVAAGSVSSQTPAAGSEVLFGASVALTVSLGTPPPYRVDAASTAASPDGATWATAYPTLQAALDAAAAAGGGELWVKKGTYTAVTDPVLTMKPYVDVYGGFAGTETDRSQRDWNLNPATIDGESARRCVLGADQVVLSGFVITRGNADQGGGMYSLNVSPTVDNCLFDSNTAVNYGGGLYADNETTVLLDCRFKGNSAIYGGGACSLAAYLTLENCVFQDNAAAYGAGLYGFRGTKISITNATFAGNKAAVRFGAVYLAVGVTSATLRNSIIYANEAPRYASIADQSRNGAEVSYSCIQGGWPGVNNIDADPLFVSSTDILRLTAASPCIDTGTAAGAPATDIDGVARPQGAGYDMGAYEYGEAAVPDVANMTEAAASATLQRAIFAVGAVTGQCSNTVAAGLIISQTPPAGEVAPLGSAVALAVSTGVCNVSVPNVANLTQTAADAALTGAGLAVGALTQQCSNTVAAGSVISQAPAAGDEAPFGSAVALAVSTGVCNVSVPNVVNLTQAAADAALAGAGLAVGTLTHECSNTVAAGSVIGQTPAAGDEAPFGSAVALTVSTGVCNVTVPNVVDQTLVAADTALTGAGLAVGALTEQCSNTVPAGSVISQTPAAGDEAPFGSAVALAISTGVCNVSVPNVVDLTRAAADAALSGASLTVGVVTEQCSNTVAVGSVISQTPTAGEQAPFGSPVALAVSTGVCNVTVPNVVDLTRTAADAALTGAGLAVGTLTEQCSNTVAAGSVISQTPAPGGQATFGSAVALVVSTGVCNVTVPNVVDQTRAAADTALVGASLTVGVVTEQCSNTIAVGSVISQTPTAGEQAPFGSAVALIVSTGLCNVTVPDLLGRTQAEAGAALTGASLTLGTITQQCSNTVATGSVISQTPTAGEQAPFGSAVALIVSTGVCNVNVPDVVNQTQAEAGAALTGASLTLGTITQQCSNTVAAGSVISQTPTAGEQAPFGSAVALVVSLGVCNVNVPDVVNQTQAEAGAALTGASLTLGTVTQQCSNTVAAGTVISQTPAAGEQAPFGSAVALVVSLGVCNVNVPDLVGLTPAEAGAALAGANLTLGTVAQQCSNTVAAGSVISQTPAPGEQAPSNSAVVLVVSTGQCDVTVPNVVGRSEEQARAAITLAGLVLGTVLNDFNEAVPEGAVIRQVPLAGASVPPGSQIQIVVCRVPGTVIPNILGMTRAEAEAAIQNAHLVVGEVAEGFSDTVPAGRVLSQSPADAMESVRGAAVSFAISLGPKSTVPDLTNMTLDEALTLLGSLRLTALVTYEASDAIPAGQVIRQDDAAGTFVPLGYTVRLTISTGPENAPSGCAGCQGMNTLLSPGDGAQRLRNLLLTVLGLLGSSVISIL